MTRYVGLLDGAKGAYRVIFPDLPGCAAGGETVDAVMSDAIGAIREWILDARNDGEADPLARDFEALKADPEVSEALRGGAAFIVVPLVIETGLPARANLSIDSGLLAAIDEAAHLGGLTRSAFIASAARAKIEQAA
jgi:predicted RNase H-like HicB family nuclease